MIKLLLAEASVLTSFLGDIEKRFAKLSINAANTLDDFLLCLAAFSEGLIHMMSTSGGTH